MAKTTTKKRNPTDATLRNVTAGRKRDSRLELATIALLARVKRLERAELASREVIEKLWDKVDFLAAAIAIAEG